jgi:16S rRNA (guanine(966)-N(2))-methyltransferase RsmD
VRETLFNWLQLVVPDARCLDLFAGSGALGLEALSRGAREVTFVESDRAAAQRLRDTLAELKASGGTVVHAVKPTMASRARRFMMSSQSWVRRPSIASDVDTTLELSS